MRVDSGYYAKDFIPKNFAKYCVPNGTGTLAEDNRRWPNTVNFDILSRYLSYARGEQ